MRTKQTPLSLIVPALLLFAAGPLAAEPATQPASADASWPQYRGPARDGIAVFFGDKLQAFKLSPEKPELLWTKSSGCGDRVSAPIIHDGNVYTSAQGGTRCLDLKTGEVRWEEKNHHTQFCMPILADGKIFAAADDGLPHGHDNYWPFVFFFKATPDKFEELGKMPAGSALACCSSPALVADRLYVHQLDCIACYDLTGK